jgi:ligand-binding sensor domain-containing protein
MQKELKSLILITAVLFIFSCKKETITPTGITLSQVNILTYVGGKNTINAAPSPAKASGKITWSSGNPAIASVNQSGVVTGVAAGNTVITATIGNVKATSTVTVSKWAFYNTANSGLASDNVYAIAIDAQGNKWLGTDNGVSEFDGTHWTTYNTANSGLAENWVRVIAIDAQGNKWFVVTDMHYSNGVVSEFDGTHWTTYNNTNTGLASNSIVSMAIDTRGNKWFGTINDGYVLGDGVTLKFDGANWTKYPRTDLNPGQFVNVKVISVDPKGNVWFGLEDSPTVWKFDGANWTTYNTYPEYGFSVFAMAPDKQGNMWIGFSQDGSAIAEFDGTTWTGYFHNFTASSVVPNLGIGVEAIAIDVQNNKWFGTDAAGIVEFDGTNWTTYNSNNSGVPVNYINAIAIDAQGNKWFGVEGGLSVLYAP